jgi:hypothetical protein
VQQLIEELHDEPFQPQYRRRPYGPSVTGWPARLRSYFWPNPVLNYEATNELMEPWFTHASELSQQLLATGRWTPDERAEAASLAMKMLSWGRVRSQRAFSAEVVEGVFLRALGLPHHKRVPMNSGWTKVAALATAFLEGRDDDAPHVIWDSRVSTSLVSRLDRLLVNGGMDPKQVFPRIGPVVGRGGSRPRLLKLRWSYAYGSWSTQMAGSGLVREIRDDLNSGGYPPMPLLNGASGEWTIRGVESVLFMDGY